MNRIGIRSLVLTCLLAGSAMVALVDRGDAWQSAATSSTSDLGGGQTGRGYVSGGGSGFVPASRCARIGGGALGCVGGTRNCFASWIVTITSGGITQTAPCCIEL